MAHRVYQRALASVQLTQLYRATNGDIQKALAWLMRIRKNRAVLLYGVLAGIAISGAGARGHSSDEEYRHVVNFLQALYLLIQNTKPARFRKFIADEPPTQPTRRGKDDKTLWSAVRKSVMHCLARIWRRRKQV